MRSELLAWTVRGAGLALGVGIVAGLAWLGSAAASVLLLVFVSILLGAALEPVIGWIRGRTRMARGGAILLVYATFFACVIGLSLVVVPTAVAQLNEIVAGLPSLLERARTWAAELRPGVLASSVTALIDSLGRNLAPAAPGADDVVALGLTVAEAVVSVGTILAIVFFWLVEHARLQRFALAFLPAHRRGGAREAWNEVETRLGLWVRGELILMSAVGLASGAVLSVLGVPSALLLAMVAAITEAIPIVGPFLGAIPAVLVAATVSPQLALVVAGAYVVIQLIEGNVLVPLVMRNTIGLSPFLVLVSLLIGGAVGGFVGAFLGVPVAASILVVLERLQARRVPVAQDAAAVESPSPDDAEERKRSLPDAPAKA